MLKLAAALLSLPAAALGVVAGTGVLMVDIQESGPGGHHFIVPVPLILAQAAADMVPRQQARLEAADLTRYAAAAQGLVQALADAPDGELVRVEDRQEQVVVAKLGHNLEVTVHGPQEEVAITLPLAAATEILSHARDGHLTAGDAVRALRHARLTRLADIQDGNDHVRVSIW